MNSRSIFYILGIVAGLAGILYDSHESEKLFSQREKSLDTVPRIQQTALITSAGENTYPVLKVVDGDTIKVSVDGTAETVRLIGINTPESVDPRKPVECFGKEASKKASEILGGRRVVLHYDQSQGKRDRYGRLLAYVYRDDGLFINQYMISEGYAYEYTYRTPHTNQQVFKDTEQHARLSKKGLWEDGVCTTASSNSAD